MFFSGFVLSIDHHPTGARARLAALPVTHGIQLLQDLMLRGTTTNLWQAGALVVIAAVTPGRSVAPAASEHAHGLTPRPHFRGFGWHSAATPAAVMVRCPARSACHG